MCAAEEIFDLPHRKNVSERLITHLSLGPEPVDVDGDGLPEQWAFRLVALILCEDRWPYQLVHDQVYAANMQNLLELEQEAPSIQPYKEVLAGHFAFKEIS